MSLDYKKFFNLENNYSIEELKNSYISKIRYINNLVLNDIDKNFYKKYIKSIYKELKLNSLLNNRNTINNIDFPFNEYDNINDVKNIISYKEIIKSNNITYIFKETKNIYNDIIEIEKKAYKKNKDGFIKEIKFNKIYDKYI